MTIELDHFFILTGPGPPQAELLSDIGLIEGAPNYHPGQGTANRRSCQRPSMVLEVLAQCERISLRLNEPHRLEIVFNQGKKGNSRDLRPDLPPLISW